MEMVFFTGKMRSCCMGGVSDFECVYYPLSGRASLPSLAERVYIMEEKKEVAHVHVIKHKAGVPADDLRSTQSHLPEGSSSQTMPAKDIIEANDVDEEENTGKATKDTKIKSTNDKKGPANALFNGKQ